MKRHTLIVLAGILLMSTPVISQNYLPLSVGNTWSYLGIGGETETQTVTGSAIIWGTETFVVYYGPSTHFDGFETYMTTENDGDVLYWGAYQTLEDWGVLLDPPVRMLDAPLFVGKAWSTTVTIYDLPDTTYNQSATYQFVVLDEDTLDVPAGRFHTFSIGQIYSPQAPPLDSSIPFLLPTESRDPSMPVWWSAGVGQVQFETTDLYQLLSYGFPTSTNYTTWGRIKKLF